jgi:hypothetical protein
MFDTHCSYLGIGLNWPSMLDKGPHKIPHFVRSFTPHTPMHKRQFIALLHAFCSHTKWDDARCKPKMRLKLGCHPRVDTTRLSDGFGVLFMHSSLRWEVQRRSRTIKMGLQACFNPTRVDFD